MTKRALCLVFALILSINSFAAIVSDNDGSAFVTKSEFEALKKDFADQVDNYNDSINAKIDGAIASYLAGIKVAKQSHVKLTSDIDVAVGKGYRCWATNGYMQYANRLSAEWIMGNASAVCFRGKTTDEGVAGGWMDISTGKVRGLYYDTDLTQQYLPSGTTSPWFVPQGSSYGNVVRVTDGGWASPPVGVWMFSAQAKMKARTKPFLYVDEKGVIQEFSNTRPLIIDMRAARGSTGATANYRWFYYAGVASGVKPEQKICDLNTLISDLPIKCFNEQDAAGADGFGNIYIVKKASTFDVNPNVFCWNPTGLCTAFDADCDQALVWSAVNSVALVGQYDVSSLMRRLVWGGNATGAGNANVNNMVVPFVSFMPNETNTTLPAEAFEEVTGYDYKRLKQKYLQVKDFKSTTDNTRNLYIYEGLPLYTAERNAELSFDINIAKAKYEAPDTDKTILWDDPSETMKIRVKNKPFTLDDDYSECIKIKIGTTESEEGTLTANKLTKVNFNVEKGKTYYLRWYCDGYNYGGEITYLGNGVETVID